jgi:hypothetical protein
MSPRPGNATRSSLRNPQVLHLHPSPAHGGADTKGRQGSAGLGLGYREADDEGGESAQQGGHGGEEAVVETSQGTGVGIGCTI